MESTNNQRKNTEQINQCILCRKGKKCGNLLANTDWTFCKWCNDGTCTVSHFDQPKVENQPKTERQPKKVRQPKVEKQSEEINQPKVENQSKVDIEEIEPKLNSGEKNKESKQKRGKKKVQLVDKNQEEQKQTEKKRLKLSSTNYVPQREAMTGVICQDCGAYYKNGKGCPLCAEIERGIVCMHCGESLEKDQENLCKTCQEFITDFGFDEEISDEELAMVDREFEKMNKGH